jgi:hypothetical protein
MWLQDEVQAGRKAQPTLAFLLMELANRTTRRKTQPAKDSGAPLGLVKVPVYR